MKCHTKYFSIVELIIVSVMAAIVLLPVAMGMGAIVKEWHTGRDIKMLQDELDRAAYFIKGVMEEAHGYQYDNLLNSKITLNGPEGSANTVTIMTDGNKVKASKGNEYTIIDRLDDLTLLFTPYADNSPLINVKIWAKRAGKEVNNSFSVFLRNYRGI